jgi:hypothetical protein
MRRLFENKKEGKRVGKVARNHIVNNFNQNIVTSMIIKRLKLIQKKYLPQKKKN